MAIRDYSQAIELNPRSAEASHNRGTACQKKGDLDEAIRDFAKAIDLNPQYREAYYHRAVALYYKQKYPAAWSDLKTFRGLGGKVNPEFLEHLRKASGRDE